jgi:hypothetical protein
MSSLEHAGAATDAAAAPLWAAMFNPLYAAIGVGIALVVLAVLTRKVRGSRPSCARSRTEHRLRPRDDVC